MGCASPTGAGTLDPQTRLRLEAYWMQYRGRDPDWPAARAEWLALGPAERELLALNLVRELIRLAPVPVAAEGGPEPGWVRPQRELLEIGEETAGPVVAEALRSGRDPVSLAPLADTLARFGAVERLLALLDQTPAAVAAPPCAPFALRALVAAGGERAVARVGAALRQDANWQLRAAAAQALGQARFSDRARAAGELAAGLADPDRFVALCAAESLAGLQQVSYAPALAELLARAQAAGDGELARTAVAGLRRLTGTRVNGDDPELWKRAAAAAAAAPR